MEKKAAAKSVKKTAVVPKTAGVNVNQVRMRAYEIFLDRGGTHGHDVEDWLKAERELEKKK